MTISVVRINTDSPLVHIEPIISVIITGAEDVAAFEKLISRGISSWDQAMPQIKVAADEIRFGKAQQNYHAQNSKATHNS